MTGSFEPIRGTERGSSITEVMVVIVILLILIVAALPQHGELRDSFGRGTAVQMIDSDLRRARNEAIAAGARSILTLESGGTSYTVGLDRPPYGGLSPDSMLFRTALPRDITLTASSTIIFDSRGFVVDQDGALVQITTTLNDNGSAYTTGVLFPTGFADYTQEGS